jgi:hypothetical protein
MRKAIYALLLCPFISFSQNTSDSITTTKHLLEGGAIVRLRLVNEVSSKTAKEGDQITFTLADDVTVGKTIVIKAGTLVQGNVEKATKAKGLGKAGELTYSLQYAKAVDGSKVYLRTTRASMEGENKTGGAVALAVVVTPLFLLKKGKDVKMAAGKAIQAFVDRDYTIEVESL